MTHNATIHVKEPDLFEAIYHATQECIQRGRQPTVILYPRQDGLVRSVERQYLRNEHYGKALDPHRIPANITVRDTLSDEHRYSGLSPLRDIGNRGGLYLARHTHPVFAELMRYTNRADVPSALQEHCILQLSLVKPLLLLDLSWSFGNRPPEVQKFFDFLEKNRDVRNAKEASHYKDTPLEWIVRTGVENRADTNYTIERAIALGAGNSGMVEGIQAVTARKTDRKGEVGNNVVVFGTDGKPLHDKLRVEKIYDFTSAPSRKGEVKWDEYKVMFDDYTNTYKLDETK